VTATEHARDLALAAANAAADKLATDIVLIDVSDRLAITDVFVIATGNNERQVEAIVDAVEEKLRLVGSKPLRREGRRDGR
jgi:ribosome-associated protein